MVLGATEGELKYTNASMRKQELEDNSNYYNPKTTLQNEDTVFFVHILHQLARFFANLNIFSPFLFLLYSTKVKISKDGPAS